MVSTTDFDSVSLGSSPSSPTNLTNMEEIEKINIINKRLRQKEARDKVSFNNPTGSVCPVCGKRFPKSKGKIYCSKECREKDKNYPSKQEVLEQYELLKTWDKVAEYFGLTRRIIQRIRNQ